MCDMGIVGQTLYALIILQRAVRIDPVSTGHV